MSFTIHRAQRSYSSDVFCLCAFLWLVLVFVRRGSAGVAMLASKAKKLRASLRSWRGWGKVWRELSLERYS